MSTHDSQPTLMQLRSSHTQAQPVHPPMGRLLTPSPNRSRAVTRLWTDTDGRSSLALTKFTQCLQCGNNIEF